MNWNKQIIALIAIIIVVSVTSCKKEGCTDDTAINYDENAKKDDGSCQFKSYEMTEVNVNGVDYTQITGTIDESITLEASIAYLLSGAVLVSNEATLTIQPGTKIYAADDGTVPYLSIARGSKINASGTATSPIVFTSVKSSPTEGDWGGIVLNGYAPFNNSNNSEASGVYGGNIASDNSGVLRYVRVEFAGREISAGKRMSGFAFYATGSGTSLNYLQAYRCAGDGFHILGGTANLSHALAYGSGDDGFEYNFGWTGAGTFWRVMQNEFSGDSGIEGLNNETNNAASPNSSPELDNIELLGRDTSAHTLGLKLMAGVKGNITNLLIKDFYTCLEIRDDQTLSNVVNGELTLSETNAEPDFFSLRSYQGSVDGNGNLIDPVLVGQASLSSNISIDGSAAINNSWISGAWIRNL